MKERMRKRVRPRCNKLGWSFMVMVAFTVAGGRMAFKWEPGLHWDTYRLIVMDKHTLKNFGSIASRLSKRIVYLNFSV